MRTLPRAGKEEIQLHPGHIYNFLPTLVRRKKMGGCGRQLQPLLSWSAPHTKGEKAENSGCLCSICVTTQRAQNIVKPPGHYWGELQPRPSLLSDS